MNKPRALCKCFLLFLFVFVKCSVSFSATPHIETFPYRNTNDTALSKKIAHPEKTGGYLMLNIGIGLNTTVDNMLTTYKAGTNIYNTGLDRRNGSRLIYNLVLDYALSNRFSAGLGVCYQLMPIIVRGPATPANNYQSWTFTDTWTRMAVSVGGDYYLIHLDEVSLYAGLRLGYNFYSMSRAGDANSFPEYQFVDLSPPPFAAQVHVGFNGAITPHLGLNAEAGLAYGGPYFAAMGFRFKF